MQANDDTPMRMSDTAANTRPHLSFFQIWNMCCGLFGVQIVWGLHNVNTSRIFQSLGAEISELPVLWIAAPLSGLLIQPLIGYFSDRTWTPLGRRRPYLLAGAILSALSLFAMPNASSLLAGSLILWLLTAAINMSMEPFRALVADTLPEDQQTQGFTMQVFFIGAGAVFASALPWMLTHWFGFSGEAEAGHLPEAVHVAFYMGGAVLVAVVSWTVFTTSERYRPPPAPVPRSEGESSASVVPFEKGLLWMACGALIALGAYLFGHEREIYLLAGVAILFGLTQLAAAWAKRRGAASLGALEIVEDILQMPLVLKRLAVVQFFTWFGLFGMWIYMIPAVAARHYGSTDALSSAYNAGADWAGVLFAVYNGVAAIGALLLPRLTMRIGRKMSHALCLSVGALALGGFLIVEDPVWLLLPAVGIGCAWASILSIPYALVSSAVPPAKTGVYMGIHNIFLVLPQLAAATILGPLVAGPLGGEAIWVLALSSGCLALAALFSLTIPHADEA